MSVFTVQGGAVSTRHVGWVGEIQEVKRAGGKGKVAVDLPTVWKFYLTTSHGMHETFDFSTKEEAEFARDIFIQSMHRE